MKSVYLYLYNSVLPSLNLCIRLPHTHIPPQIPSFSIWINRKTTVVYESKDQLKNYSHPMSHFRPASFTGWLELIEWLKSVEIYMYISKKNVYIILGLEFIAYWAKWYNYIKPYLIEITYIFQNICTLHLFLVYQKQTVLYILFCKHYILLIVSLVPRDPPLFCRLM